MANISFVQLGNWHGSLIFSLQTRRMFRPYDTFDYSVRLDYSKNEGTINQDALGRILSGKNEKKNMTRCLTCQTLTHMT